MRNEYRWVSFLLLALLLPAMAAPLSASDDVAELLRGVQDRSLRRQLIQNHMDGTLDADELARIASGDDAPSAPGRALPLGAQIEGNRTVFRVWSPRATSLELVLYDSATAEDGRSVAMERKADGVWEASVKGKLAGTFYAFHANGPEEPGDIFRPETPLSDPYARANVGSHGRSIVVDPSFRWTDGKFKAPAQKDLVVYEMHIRDYSQHPSAGVGGQKKGRYLGLLEGQSSDKVLGNLLQLGVNAVELLPVHQYDVNAAPPGHINHWGYMTSHYFAPADRYASDSVGAAVTEFKKLVDGLHKAGIAVILDVVYNHSCEGNEQGPVLNFRGLANQFYYRLTPDSYYWNGTGCGNELRSEHPGTRRLILDSLRHWVEEYHVDGFRFDLAAGIDKDTLLQAKRELPNTYMISEPWTADWNRAMWRKGDLRGSGWANWNDDFKHAIRGLCKGEVDKNKVKTVMAGSCFWWAANPQETVNFIECHDNGTLDDFLGHDEARNRLGAVALLTAQGIPMLHEGQEFCKNKKGNDNSYDQDNDVNWIDWKRKAEKRHIFDFYKGLIAIRLSRPHFRKTNPLGGADVEWMESDHGQALGFRLKENGRKDVIVLLNASSDDWVTFGLPGGSWKALCNGVEASPTGVDQPAASGSYQVPALSGVILEAE